MSDLVDQLRVAFDGDDIPQKNIALRKAHAEVERLRAEIDAFSEERDHLQMLADNLDWFINNYSRSWRKIRPVFQGERK